VELIKINVTGHWYVIGVNGVKRAGDAMRGPLSMGGYRITDLAAPTNANDAARKADVDAITTEKINTTAYRPATEDGSTYPIGVTSFAVTSGVSDGWPQDAGVVLTTRLSNIRCLQIFMASSATGAQNGRVYVRSWRSDRGWSDWRRQWDNQEMGAGSGLDADLLRGMQPSTSATPNTIVQRDPYGRFKSAAPSASDDVARKAEVDAKLSLSGGTIIGELSIRAPGQNSESAVNLFDNTGIRKGRLFYHLDSDRVIFRKYAPSGAIAADVLFNESEFRYRVGSTYYNVWHSGNLPYETGTWTPELTFGNSSSGITYGNRKGQYTRIGNVVYWTMEMQLSSKGTATGTARISGLPFIPLSTAPDVILPVGYATRITLPSGGEWASAQIFWNSAVLVLFASGNVGTNAVITNEHFTDNSGLKIQGFYFIPN
jgi:hypothetical protein